MKGKIVRRAALGAAVAVLVLGTAGFMLMSDAELFLKINKSIDVFGRVYKEIAANYVDEVDPEKFMEAGIDGMLGTLDPYTVYISKDESEEVDLLTSGKYGGIGVTIGQREGAVRVISVMDGYSAQRQGIQPGDVILEIDGVQVSAKKPDDVRTLTRGEPGTEVKVKVQREGEAAPLDFVLVREEIQMKNVTYAASLRDGIGYIRLERFSRKAGDEVRQAVKDLKLQGALKGLVLDLRGNPGGLLDAAVDVVSKFIPRGSLVVSTRGRKTETDKKYLTAEEPVLPSTPLVVLTDHGSASASEIVTGTLQDMDRALVVGTRTFGKGLVQTIVPLNFGAQLKITTARYYIPSGRSIQEIDYQHKDRSGVFAVLPDSLRHPFKTVHGRKVFERGGITPDSTVNDPDEGAMVRELQRRSIFFKFATSYVASHRHDPYRGMTPEILAAFRKYLQSRDFDYQEESEAKVKELREQAVRLHYGTKVVADLDTLSETLRREKLRGFDRYKDHITHELDMELTARYQGERGRIEASLRDDPQLDAAIGMLSNTKLYSKKLGI